jgi:hypothetical protein
MSTLGRPVLNPLQVAASHATGAPCVKFFNVWITVPKIRPAEDKMEILCVSSLVIATDEGSKAGGLRGRHEPDRSILSDDSIELLAGGSIVGFPFQVIGWYQSSSR